MHCLFLSCLVNKKYKSAQFYSCNEWLMTRLRTIKSRPSIALQLLLDSKVLTLLSNLSISTCCKTYNRICELNLASCHYLCHNWFNSNLNFFTSCTSSIPLWTLKNRRQSRHSCINPLEAELIVAVRNQLTETKTQEPRPSSQTMDNLNKPYSSSFIRNKDATYVHKPEQLSQQYLICTQKHDFVNPCIPYLDMCQSPAH